MSSQPQKTPLNVWTTYDNWRKEAIFCPALDSQIKATLRGWNHISGAGKKRLKQDAERRLKLLPHAMIILQKTTTIQHIAVINEKKHFAFESVEVVGKKEPKAYRKIKVIVEEQKDGSRAFLSVMDRKTRSQI